MKRQSEFLPIGERQRWGAMIILASSVIVLVIAWGFQLIGGYVPCKLCLEQREAYYLAIPLAGLALVGIAMKWPAMVVRCILGLMVIGFLFSATTAIYQAGAEWRFWPGPSDCGGGSVGGGTGGDLMAQMSATRIVPCDEASWRFLYLSFAGWNAIIALLLAKFTGLVALVPGK